MCPFLIASGGRQILIEKNKKNSLNQKIEREDQE
jgi:hypothetical protein